MTNDITIRVENLGKRYRIGEHVSYRTLRETIMDSLKRPLDRLSRSHKSKTHGFRENAHIWALRGVSLEVKAGEVVGIIGPNGAGKTTLLKILSRITKPTTGYAEVNGRVGSLLEVGTGFHPELTGRENIYLNGSVLGMKKPEIDRKFDAIVSFAEIERFLDTPVKRYSSGMYVRLAFAVAAHLEPEVLLVDEVLAVGDSAFQKKCLGKMGDVARQGRTVLLISHNMNAIRALCKNAAWLDSGRTVTKGSADEVVGHYERSQIKSFDESSFVATREPKDLVNSSFYVSGVEIMNTKGERTNTFSYNEELVLIVSVFGEPIGNSYSLEFRIYKESGEFVAVGSSGSYHDVYFDRKTKKVKTVIGPLILTKGKYTISLSLVSGVVRDESLSRIDAWDSACSFNIAQCHPFPTGHDVDNRSVCVLKHSFSAMK